MTIAVVLRLRDGTEQGISVIDEEDLDDVMPWRWRLTTDGYACRTSREGEIFMHRQLLGLKVGSPLQGDHINRDRLDNRRANLRIVTRWENTQNQRPIGRTSRFRGVSRSMNGCRWRARVWIKGVAHHLGHFVDEQDAARAAAAFRAQHMPFSEDALLLGKSSPPAHLPGLTDGLRP